ncbi:hypothetical protein JCM3770_005025 [Rhodotorula araucariae]
MLRVSPARRPCLCACPRARLVSTVRVVLPPPSSPRQLALPLAFVSVSGWADHGIAAWLPWVDRFAARGYSSLLLDVDPAKANAHATSDDCLAALEQELVSLLRDPAASSPFPPLLFASSASSLLAESYVSSHPLSGLCLVSPLSAPAARAALPSAFPTTLDEFNYEPGFPIAVVAPQDSSASEHRLVEAYGPLEGDDPEDALVRRIVGGRDAEGWNEVMEWMDTNGL